MQTGASIGGNAMPATGTCPGGQVKCCGDKICDGPETVANCPADCSTTTGSSQASSYYIQQGVPQGAMNSGGQSSQGVASTMQSGASMQGGMQQTMMPQQSGEHPYNLV
jgi:hypothetical protein